MRYKEVVLKNVDKLENQFRTLEFIITRAQTLDEVTQQLNDMKESLTEIRNLVNIEPDEMKMDQIV